MNLAATLFQYFREVRDSPTPEARAKLESLNKQTLIATNNAARLASIVGFEDCVKDWSEEQHVLNDIYDELETRMKDPKIKEIIDKVLKYQGSTPGIGLLNLKESSYLIESPWPVLIGVGLDARY